MFKFNFNVEEDLIDHFQNGPNVHSIASAHCDENINWYESQKIEVDTKIIDDLDIYKLNSVPKKIGDISMYYLISGSLLRDISHSDASKNIKVAEQHHSDLIPGVYEGGAKIWECTDDLLHYISKNELRNTWQNTHILDLGCGSGLLGIYALKCGAKVHFQDYNQDVLEEITIPNVLLNYFHSEDEHNFDSNNLHKVASFYSGDWEKYIALTKNEEKFDIILTSETIYNTQNQIKLLNCFDAKLKTNGIVLLAAKSYYFGVGGGIQQFEELIINDKRFSTNVVWKAVEGVGREILELRRNS